MFLTWLHYTENLVAWKNRIQRECRFYKMFILYKLDWKLLLLENLKSIILITISLRYAVATGLQLHTCIRIYIYIYILYIYIYIYIVPDIGLAVRVFANGPGDLGSIPGRVIPKTQKMVLDASLLNTQHYKVRIKGKVEQSWEGVAPSPTPWCSSYRKGSLRVTLDYGRQLYFTYIYIYSKGVDCYW